MGLLEIEYVDISTISPYKGNAKLHPQEQIDQIKKSIEMMGFDDPIAIWKNGEIIEGHGRYIAAQQLGIKTVPIIRLDSLTDEQRRAYALIHNQLTMNTGFDVETLNLELAEIKAIDMEAFDFLLDPMELNENAGNGTGSGTGEEEEHGKLIDTFIVPPFSVLDTRQGYWRERREKWEQITGDLSQTRDGEYGTLSAGGDSIMKSINAGTSNFDPVLAETMMKWFCIEGGHILDPFGGEQTKGVVAGECGYKYTAVEFRQEQVDVNTAAVQKYPDVNYICGDSNNISKLVKKRGFDFCFTSPPYYDLEVYSKEDMSALGTYEEFMQQYKNIFQQCFNMLAQDTFLAIKVGEIRDKKTGIYRNFVGDTITCMLECGFCYYNELVLINPAGTLPQRAGRSMRTRKVGKMHQNVLVFYKGNPQNIGKKYPELRFDELEDEMNDDAAAYDADGVEVIECSLN